MMKGLLLFGIFVAGLAYLAMRCCHHGKVELTTYPETEIWGNSKEDKTITPFSVKIDPKDVADLKRRLAEWRRHEPLEDVGRAYGFAGERLDNLVKYWREKYDFAKFETKLNSLPQFTTVINGLKIHFLHVKGDSKAAKRVPLLLAHGWPGSIVEFHHVIPLLTSVGKDGIAFDVVAPSLPGFAFSEAASKPGLNPIAIAQIFHTLMKRLGYEKFVYQGGDWGSVIGGMYSRMYPESLIGYHASFMVVPTASLCSKLHLAAAFLAPKLVVGEDDAAKLSKLPSMLIGGSGYFHEQATKPDTLGVGLSDSPVGFLAWVAEKLEVIAEHAEFKGDKGGISNDDLLTNVMVYWYTNHITSASRIYKEFVQAYSLINAGWGSTPITVPSAVACYPYDIPCSPKALLKHTMPRLVHYADIPHGGHFPALEEPQLFEQDLRTAVTAFFQAHQLEKEPKQ